MSRAVFEGTIVTISLHVEHGNAHAGRELGRVCQWARREATSLFEET